MQEAPQGTPQPAPVQQMGMKPSRGGAVLTLGILGIVLTCFILGIIAWVMGKGDLSEMKEGKRDSSGEQLTKAGMICGIISVGLTIFGLLWSLIMFLVVGSSAFLGGICGL